MPEPTTPTWPRIPDDDRTRSLGVTRPNIDESLPRIGSSAPPTGSGILHGEIRSHSAGRPSLRRRETPFNVPAAFHNAGDEPARGLCLASAASVEDFVAAITPVTQRAEAPPKLDHVGQAAFIANARQVSLRLQHPAAGSVPG